MVCTTAYGPGNLEAAQEILPGLATEESYHSSLQTATMCTMPGSLLELEENCLKQRDNLSVDMYAGSSSVDPALGQQILPTIP